MNIFLVEFNPFQPAHTPISLGYLASCAKREGHGAEILTLGSDSLLSVEAFTDRLLRLQPRIVGFSAYQRNIFLVHGWARLCKEALPGCLTVIGGPQATFMPTAALNDLPFLDMICRSEGEIALLSLLRWLSDADRTHEAIPGWSGRASDGLWDGPEPAAPADLDAYPSPYLDGTIDLSSMDEAIMLGSRGCPYRCAFCYTPAAFGKKVRFHSVDRVIEEISWITKNGVSRFWFADPSFSLDGDRVHRILDAILTRGLVTEIWLETRVDLVDRDLLGKMKRAGVHTVAYGLESGSERVLEKIRKPLALDQVERAIRLSQEAGVDVELFSQYGLPGESFEDAMKTFRFVQDHGVAIRGNTNPQQMQIYFGTQIQCNPDAFGIRPFPESFPSYLSIGSRYETDAMHAEEIRKVGLVWREASRDGGKHIVS